jgi:hypothetical protein
MIEETRYVRGLDAHERLLDGPLGALLLLGPVASDGRLSLVEHALAPRALGAPVHSIGRARLT